jgi:hypothetical protein
MARNPFGWDLSPGTLPSAPRIMTVHSVHSANDQKDQFRLSVRSSFPENRLKMGAYCLVLNTERLRAGSQRLSCN